MRNLGQDSLCPERDLNRAPPEYQSRASPLEQPVRSLDCVDGGGIGGWGEPNPAAIKLLFLGEY
jgi:hypothetical protein